MQKVSQELHVTFESRGNLRLSRPCVELSVFVSHDVENPEKVKENPYPKHAKTSMSFSTQKHFLGSVKVNNDTVERMQSCLDTLSIPLTVVWVPNRNTDKHGEINLNSKTLLIFDDNEKEAWFTFEHEVYDINFVKSP